LFFIFKPSQNLSSSLYDPQDSIASNYLKIAKHNLSSIQEQFLLLTESAHFSFYQVQQVNHDNSIEVQDLLFNTHHTIVQDQRPYQFECADIICATLLIFNKQSYIMGIFSYAIEYRYTQNILTFKKELKKMQNHSSLYSKERISQNDFFIRQYYFDLISNQLNAFG
jgi:hypothetical protein